MSSCDRVRRRERLSERGMKEKVKVKGKTFFLGLRSVEREKEYRKDETLMREWKEMHLKIRWTDDDV